MQTQMPACSKLVVVLVFAGALTLTMVSDAPGQDRTQGRSMVISRYGIVAAESPLAAQAGVQMLERGGTAVDAAIAANAVMGVVAPMSNGIGGDLFAIVYDAQSKKLYGLNASGWAPTGLTLEFLRGQGVQRMPQRGIHSVTVPGAVDGWQKLLERFGKKKFSEVLAPAIRTSEDGFPVTEWTAALWNDNAGALRADPAAVKTYLPSGRAPAVGEVFRNADLARSLRLIAQGGRDAFYKGDIARLMVAGSRRLGGTLAENDLAEFSSEWVEPISTSYRGWTVHELPPNGQGLAALEMLNMMETFPLPQWGLNSARTLHAMIEAKKLAYADLVRYIGDPKFSKLPVAELLSAPHHPYTSGLGASIPSILERRRRLPQIQGTPPDPATLPPGCAFAPRCPVALERCSTDAPALEDAGRGRRSACHRSAGLMDGSLTITWERPT